ncbi:MAG: hypothetical protein Q9222_005471 [Ikaeria aurantiellina]
MPESKADMSIVRGLYYGMNLLNEFEPLSEELNMFIHPFFRKFIDQLKPIAHFRLGHLDADGKFVGQIKNKPGIDDMDQLMESLILKYQLLIPLIPRETHARIYSLIKECNKRSLQYKQEQQEALEAARQANSYNKAKLPFIPRFLNLDGQIVCRHKECNGTTTIGATGERERYRATDSRKAKSVLEFFQNQREWGVLRELRAEFASRNRRQLAQFAKSDSVGLKMLSKQCRTSMDLLDTGILTLKDIISGGSPASLKKVFAFMNLSFSAATVMRKRGLSTSFSPTALDLAIWRRAVPEISDQAVYDELIHLMLPEIYDDYDKECISQRSALWEGSTMDFNSAATNMLQDFRHSPGFDFSIFDEISHDYVDPEARSEQSSRHEGSSWEPLEALSNSELECGFDSVFEQQNDLEIFPDVAHHDSGWHGYAPSLSELLTATVIFSVVISFINYFVRYMDVIKFRIINPLLLDPELSDLGSVIVTVRKMLEVGWLSSIQGLENYIIAVTSQLPLPEKIFYALIQKTLNGCLTAASEVDPKLIYNTRHGEANEYTLEVAPYEQDISINHEELPTLSEGPMNLDPMMHDNGLDASHHTKVDKLWLLSADSRPQKPSIDDTTIDICSANAQSDKSSATTMPSLSPSSQRPPPSTTQRKTCDVDGCDHAFTGAESASNLRRHKREKHTNRSLRSCPFQNSLENQTWRVTASQGAHGDEGYRRGRAEPEVEGDFGGGVRWMWGVDSGVDGKKEEGGKEESGGQDLDDEEAGFRGLKDLVMAEFGYMWRMVFDFGRWVKSLGWE